MLAEKGDIIGVIRGNCQRDMESVQNAPGDLLEQRVRAPWGTEGPLADVIIDSIGEHIMTHVRDLAKVVA